MSENLRVGNVRLTASLNTAVSGTVDHRDLTNRDAADQHPIGAVTGLQTALDGKQPTGDYALRSELPSVAGLATEQYVDAAVGEKQDTLIASGAAVGQIAKISAVDAAGKPTAWEAAAMPQGGSFPFLTGNAVPIASVVANSNITDMTVRNLPATDALTLVFDGTTTHSGMTISINGQPMILNQLVDISNITGFLPSVIVLYKSVCGMWFYKYLLGDMTSMCMLVPYPDSNDIFQISLATDLFTQGSANAMAQGSKLDVYEGAMYL